MIAGYSYLRRWAVLEEILRELKNINKKIKLVYLLKNHHHNNNIKNKHINKLKNSAVKGCNCKICLVIDFQLQPLQNLKTTLLTVSIIF